MPKIIHYVWIGGPMPETKRRVIEMNKAFYPDFTLKIWYKENITKEAFPYSYDLLMTLYNMENISRYSKRATMADVMRHEIVYHEGGFYMDTSMYLFGDIFYKWRSYKFALATERTFRHRWSQSMCIFAAMPKFPPLLRIITHNNTNRYQIWSSNAMEIAGPHNFRWTVRGMEEYDPDYLIMDYEAFYSMTYDLPNFWDSYCCTESRFLSKSDEILMQWGNTPIIKNCGKYYPYAFGREVNRIGGSWMRPKW
jgi:mannosyltransferase OCH1-like enzyme